MKQTFLSIILILLPIMASADPVEIDGIYYNLIVKGKIAEVTINPNLYSGYIVIPQSIKYGDELFTVTKIADDAFNRCSNLLSVYIPNSITTIGNQAFRDCKSLTSLIIPNSITSIGDYAFSGLTLTAISIPESVKKIGHSIFRYSTGIISIIIPNSVSFIDLSYAFEGCTALIYVSIPEHLTSIEKDAFWGCSSLASFTISNNVISINDYAFMNCSNLKSIDIPNSVSTIYKGAFSNCTNLETVTLGTGIRSIGDKAFSNCVALENVYCYSLVVPYTKSNAFEESYPEYITLYVPASSIEAYRAVEPWNKFKDIVAIKNTLTYMVDGEVFKIEEVEYGSTITPPNPEDREGYDFAWGDYPSTMPAEDITIYGTYTATGIETILDTEPDVKIYTVSGKQINKLQKGVNILRYKDGRSKKNVFK